MNSHPPNHRQPQAGQLSGGRNDTVSAETTGAQLLVAAAATGDTSLLSGRIHAEARLASTLRELSGKKAQDAMAKRKTWKKPDVSIRCAALSA
jgi:hypothetical protein